MIKNEYEHYTQFCGTCVGSFGNQNISNAQKELFLWYLRWVIIMHSIQEIVKPQQVEELDGTRHVMAPIIVPKLATAANCALPFVSLAYWIDPRSYHLDYQKSNLYLRRELYFLATGMK